MLRFPVRQEEGAQVDEESQGECGEGPGEGLSVSLSQMSGGPGPVVHTLLCTLRLLPLQSWRILPPAPAQPTLPALCPLHTLPAGQEQDMQGQETGVLLTYLTIC